MLRFDRRKLLLCTLQLPVALAGAKAAEAACIDPDEMSDSVRGMRESLEYTDTASEPQKACAACTYFKAEKVGVDCGHCEVLGGSVSGKGRCVSWTKRA